MASVGFGQNVTKKCGIRLSPPALVTVYEDTVSKKTRKYIMPVRNFRANSNVNFIAEDLKMRHSKALSHVPLLTIEKMLRILQEHIKGSSLEEAVEMVTKEFSVDENEDLNKLSSEAIKRKKDIMSESFNKNQVSQNDPDFVYDKQVEFDQSEQKETSAWDSEETDDFWG